jgi:hypothetical protein
MLTCTRKDCPCPGPKDESEFDRNQRNKSGRNSACKVCRKNYDKRVRHTPSRAAVRKRANEKYMKTDKGKAMDRVIREQPSKRFSMVKANAKARGKLWLLTKEEFIGLVVGSKCHYCGGELPKCGSALDRKDCAGPYSTENCVPACTECNVAKSDHFSYEEMVEIVGPAIRAVHERRAKSSDIVSVSSEGIAL